MLLTERFRERDPLAPARWSEKLDAGEFDEPFPWKILLGFLGIVLVIAFAHLKLQAKRIEELRAAIHLKLDGEFEPLRSRFEQRALLLKPWVEAPSIEGPAFRDDALDFESIRGGGIISLRRRPPGEPGVSMIAASDELGGCLGVPNASLARVQEALDFFTPELIEEVDETDHFLTLRGLQDQIERRIDGVLPELVVGLDARYLLLSEEDREARELLVYLVDLEAGEPKLRARLPYDGRLLTARVMLDKETSTKTPGAILLPTELPKGASDCAAASALREAIEGRGSFAEPAPKGRDGAAE